MMNGADPSLTPFRVGLLVVGSFVAFLLFLQIVSTRNISGPNAVRLSALFDDVLGLEPKSPVQIAGIDVGRIVNIRLERGKARVEIELRGGIEVYPDATLEKVAISLLGDYKLALAPGTPASGPRLESGDTIQRVKSLSNIDEIVTEIRQMSASLKGLIAGEDGAPAPLERIVADVQVSAAAARAVLEEVSGSVGTNSSKLDRIISNIEVFTSDLARLSSGRASDVGAIMKDTRALAASLRVTAENIEEIVAGQSKTDLDETVRSLRSSIDTLNRGLESIASITGKIDQGQGTIGQLVNDDSIAENLQETAEGLNSLVGGISSLQTWVNLRSEFQVRSGALKNYVQFSLQPQSDKMYIFEVVDDPRGVQQVVIEDVQTTSPEPGRAFSYRERRTTTRNALKFSVMFYRRYYWLGLRFGVIESTGGIGANLYFLNDRLEILADLNRFGEEARLPRFKGLALFEPIDHVYIHAGVDDLLNQGTIDFFMGLGVRFNDDDLKTLLAVGGGGLAGN